MQSNPKNALMLTFNTTIILIDEPQIIILVYNLHVLTYIINAKI